MANDYDSFAEAYSAVNATRWSVPALIIGRPSREGRQTGFLCFMFFVLEAG